MEDFMRKRLTLSIELKREVAKDDLTHILVGFNDQVPKIAKFVATETMPVNSAALNTDRTWYPNMVPSS